MSNRVSNGPVLTMARVMLDEVRLRAAVGPIDEPAG